MTGTTLGIIQALMVLGGLGGLWRAVHIVLRGRAAVALEHARSAATLAAIERLPSGSRLLEHDPNGRTRAIDIPGPRTQVEFGTEVEREG